MAFEGMSEEQLRKLILNPAEEQASPNVEYVLLTYREPAGANVTFAAIMANTERRSYAVVAPETTDDFRFPLDPQIFAERRERLDKAIQMFTGRARFDPKGVSRDLDPFEVAEQYFVGPWIVSRTNEDYTDDWESGVHFMKELLCLGKWKAERWLPANIDAAKDAQETKA